ncbi:hypothetical protein vseg_005496 [Gypsophila vaccaria]
MGENQNCADMISDFPDFILHQILSYLPAKAAAKTCVISKRWCHIWKTFPIVDCCQFFFGKYLDIVNPKELGLPKDVRRNIFQQRVKFMSYIDDKLGLISENDICVKKFRLVMTLVSVGLFPRVDFWMDLVSGLRVQELELRLTLGRERFYTLPTKVLASQSLTILSLKGRIWIDCLSKDDVKLSSLVELHLHGCFIDEEAITNLVSSIQSLEVLSLKSCLGFTRLEIHGHQKLRKVVYHPHMDLKIKKICIDLPNLEELEFVFSYRTKRKLAFIRGIMTPNLKRLSLCGVFIDVKSVGDIVSSFPLLEHLFLGECVVKEAVKLRSSMLKELYLRNCSDTVKAEFETPTLHVFKYYSKNMSRLSINNVAGHRIAELPVSLRDMDSSWFTKLNNFLSKNRFHELILSITAGQSAENNFSIESHIRERLRGPFELEGMKLVIYAFTSVKYAALLDCLFWNLHPKNLKLELHYRSPVYVKGLLESLVVAEEPKCCQAAQEENLKCWRHSLKGIKFANVKGFETGTPLDLCKLNSLNNFLDKWASEAQSTLDCYETVKGLKLSFDLLW